MDSNWSHLEPLLQLSICPCAIADMMASHIHWCFFISEVIREQQSLSQRLMIGWLDFEEIGRYTHNAIPGAVIVLCQLSCL